MATPQQLDSVVDLNSAGRFVHWSIFTVSVANLVVIAVMVVLFGAALLIRFPRDDESELAAAGEPARPDGVAGAVTDPTMWTARVRRLALQVLPPGKLLPDRQPAYMASWIYVFGVATVAALAIVVGSGVTIALGGTDWWHTNPVGHFFNSVHLWSVEVFMAFMVIHLWGKFWMAAWRGRRALTWITGGVAFGASIVECFTGYLSQQNFDSQWIATNGKDAINATGLGAFFNLMDFGQMLLWHVVLIPILLVSLVGAHVLLVRVRGIVPPLPQKRPTTRSARHQARRADAAQWHGPTRRYDILKEATLAGAVCLALVILLAAVLSSPNEPPVTVASWAKVAPADFLATAADELAATSETASYGPPYNHQSGNVQRIGISWQTLAGVTIPVDPAQAFVLGPLSADASTDPGLRAALVRYSAAPDALRTRWSSAFAAAVTKVTFVGRQPRLPAASDGPLPAMLSTELTLARSGALDADLLADQPFYGTNFTKPLLFLEDGQYFSGLATAQHLTGDQWGVLNETGNYPGQPWLWLYQLWYQLPGFKSSANVDLIAVYLTGAATLLLLAIPFVPGLRDVPEIVPLHRAVWRRWNGRATRPEGVEWSNPVQPAATIGGPVPPESST
jgi:hypothetical protein